MMLLHPAHLSCLFLVKSDLDVGRAIQTIQSRVCLCPACADLWCICLVFGKVLLVKDVSFIRCAGLLLCYILHPPISSQWTFEDVNNLGTSFYYILKYSFLISS